MAVSGKDVIDGLTKKKKSVSAIDFLKSGGNDDDEFFSDDDESVEEVIEVKKEEPKKTTKKETKTKVPTVPKKKKAEEQTHVVVDMNKAMANMENAKKAMAISDDRDTEEVQSLPSIESTVGVPKTIGKSKNYEEVATTAQTNALLAQPLVYWRKILSLECQVYVCGSSFIGKPFDEINYQFCGEDGAKQMVEDNIYALLRFKYFKKMTDESEKRISDIAKAFVSNLKSSLIKVSFKKGDDCMIMKQLDDGCVAFRNGVYDFKANNWLFKYDIVEMPDLKNKIYSYDPSYAIMWHFDIEFEPWNININELSLEGFIDYMKSKTMRKKNFCFELCYNMCHDENDKYSYKRFVHLCEILGYTMVPGFVQKFVMLIGSGGNGKNSLFDGCFTENVIPKPMANSLTDIETDKFVTGTFENVYHNIFLETEARPLTESKMIKQLTGSTNQATEKKGQDKRITQVNCKFIFSGNDQDKIKFSDNTDGFRRRINLFEIWYKWDKQLAFMKRGDYYNTQFSYDLKEIKNDVDNAIAYVYLAEYGILSATRNFTASFDFSENDWRLSYSDIDFNEKDMLDNLTMERVIKFLSKPENKVKYADIFYDEENPTRKVLYKSKTLTCFGIDTFDKMLETFKDEETRFEYFTDYNVYIDLSALQNIVGDKNSVSIFNSNFKKMYAGCKIARLSHNRPYVLVTFVNDKMKVRC